MSSHFHLTAAPLQITAAVNLSSTKISASLGDHLTKPQNGVWFSVIAIRGA